MQETTDNSNRLKNSLLKDTQVKQENIKIHGIGLDKAGRCTHYHTQLDIAALLCAKCRKYYRAILVMMNWKIIHLPQQHRKKLILFYAETAAGNLHFRNTKGSCPYCHAGFNPKCSLHENIYFCCTNAENTK